jgi:hypothetical protein
VAEKRKFAALADLQRHVTEVAVVEAPPEPPPESEPTITTQELGKGRGRPATGKRSNPEWKLYSHFLKKRTQRAAVARLQAEESERDLSDILQELLENWLKSKPSM